MCSLYRKLWTEFFSLPYGPSVERTGHKKGESNSPYLMVQTKQMKLIRCLLYGYKCANGPAGNICGPYHKLWTNQSELVYYVSHIINLQYSTMQMHVDDAF